MMTRIRFLLYGDATCTMNFRSRSCLKMKNRIILSNRSPVPRRGVTTQSHNTKDTTTPLPPLFWKNSVRTSNVAALSALSLAVGFLAGRYTFPDDGSDPKKCTLPDGLPRTCCDHDTPILTEDQFNLTEKLSKLVGEDNVLDGSELSTKTSRYLKGARLGGGPCLCIVTPDRVHHVQDIVQAAVDADCAILAQGQNTGLTGGSVPHTTDTSRPIVVLSLRNLKGIFPLDDGERVACLAGTGLASLQQFLSENFPNRESHSELGSTFLNPTTAAGVALGSGGTQCRKGPAYTERALCLQVTTNKWKERRVEVVNTLNIEGMEDREFGHGRGRKTMDSVAYRIDIWSRWIREGYERTMKYSEPGTSSAASDVGYASRLCNFDSQVSRCNADTSGPNHCRSEGKVIVLATVHDTFEKPKLTQTYWVGFDSLDTALRFRKDVALDNPSDLPISLEYMDRDAFDVVDQGGRVMGALISLVGTSSPLLASMWNCKLWIEALPFAGAPLVVDKFLYTVNSLVPPTLPSPIQTIGHEMDHHVMMTVGEFEDGSMQRLLDRMNVFAEQNPDKVVVHECTAKAQSLKAFRFVAAPAFRTWCVGQGLQGYSVDYALPKNGGGAPPLTKMPSDASKLNTQTKSEPVKRLRYSHFACNVVHEDLAYSSDVDIGEAKHALKDVIEEQCGGKLPAEHGHGTEYTAPIKTQQRWQAMDPLNVLNPGVGGLSQQFEYRDDKK